MDNLRSLAALCERAADTWPGRPALTHNGVTHTYADLAARSWSMTAMLARNQVRPGDRVAIATSDVAELGHSAVRRGAPWCRGGPGQRRGAGLRHRSIVGDCPLAIAVCPAQSPGGACLRVALTARLPIRPRPGARALAPRAGQMAPAAGARHALSTHRDRPGGRGEWWSAMKMCSSRPRPFLAAWTSGKTRCLRAVFCPRNSITGSTRSSWRWRLARTSPGPAAARLGTACSISWPPTRSLSCPPFPSWPGDCACCPGTGHAGCRRSG